MKKLLLSISLATLFVLGACGGDSDNDNDGDSNDDSNDEDNDDDGTDSDKPDLASDDKTGSRGPIHNACNSIFPCCFDQQHVSGVS